MFLVEVPTIHASPLTLSHLLPEGNNQITRKLFLHCWPTVVVEVRLKIKRMGNGSGTQQYSGCSRMCYYETCIHTQNNSTDFYYLVINYNYILVDNKIHKNMAVTSSVKYTMQTIQNLLHAVLAKFTILCQPPPPPPHTHTKSTIFNILSYSNWICLGTGCKTAYLCP
jgi:hypothetical protein